jgi:hypothetical protein
MNLANAVVPQSECSLRAVDMHLFVPDLLPCVLLLAHLLGHGFVRTKFASFMVQREETSCGLQAFNKVPTAICA